MIKPTAYVMHTPGKRSTVYHNDYERLMKYCDQLERENKILAEAVNVEVSQKVKTLSKSAIYT